VSDRIAHSGLGAFILGSVSAECKRSMSLLDNETWFQRLK